MQVFSNTTQDSRDTDAFTLQHNQLVMFCFFVYVFLQELERRADIWFVDRMLPRCFQSWVEFTLHSRMLQQRRLKAQAYNR